MVKRGGQWPNELWVYCAELRSDPPITYGLIAEQLWKLIEESKNDPGKRETALQLSLISAVPGESGPRVPNASTIRKNLVAYAGSDLTPQKPEVVISQVPPFNDNSLQRATTCVDTENEPAIKINGSDTDAHLKSIITGLHTHDLHDLLLVPSPEINVGYGPGYLKVEVALSSLEEWSATPWAKWAGDHNPELPIWEMMKVVRKAMKGYSRAMRNVEGLAIKEAQSLGLVWDRDDAEASEWFSDDLWGVPLRWVVGNHFPQSCARLVEKPVGKIEKESLGEGRIIFRLVWQYEGSERPVAEATTLEVMEQAKAVFESAGDKWSENEGVRCLITSYYHAKQSMDEFKSAILAINVDDLNGGRCPACPSN